MSDKAKLFHKQPCSCLPCRAMNAQKEAAAQARRKRKGAEPLAPGQGTTGVSPDRHSAVPPSQTKAR